MELMTKEIQVATPNLYKTEEIPTDDKLITAKFFAGHLTWYLVEYDPEERLCFGYVRNDADPLGSEWGYFSINEFEEYNRHIAFPVIERDLYFEPVKFKELKLEKAW